MSTKALILVAVPLVFELTFVGTLSGMLYQVEQERAREAHARNVITHLNNLLRFLLQKATANVIYHIVDNEASHKRFNAAGQRIKEELKILPLVVQGDPEEEAGVAQMIGIIDNGEKEYWEARANMDGHDRMAALMSGLKVQKGFDKLFRTADEMMEKSQADEEKRNAILERLYKMVQILIGCGVVFNIGLAIALAIVFNRSTSSRLKVLMDNVIRFGRAKELHPPLSGNDELAELDRFFRSMVSSVRELETMKRNFLAMVSHDIKTPLTSIQMVHDLLAAEAYGKLNEAGHESLRMAEENTSRLIRLVNELLEIERLETGKLKLECKPTAMTAILKTSMESVSAFASDHKVTVRLDAPNDLVAFADSDRIIQVVVNILSNAVKFSPPDSEIVISLSETNNSAEIRVKDQGRGVPLNLQAEIFDRFKQVSKEDASVKGGTGLGLAICKEIVEQHGGTIGLSSEDGIGSTFWFHLPLANQIAAVSGSKQTEMR